MDSLPQTRYAKSKFSTIERKVFTGAFIEPARGILVGKRIEKGVEFINQIPGNRRGRRKMITNTE